MSTFQAEPAVNTVPSPGAEEEARDDQARDPGGNEQQRARDRRQQGAGDHGLAPADAVGEPRRSGRQTIPVKAKAPLTIPTSRSEPFSSSLT